jgi:hypothetical protein
MDGAGRRAAAGSGRMSELGKLLIPHSVDGCHHLLFGRHDRWIWYSGMLEEMEKEPTWTIGRSEAFEGEERAQGALRCHPMMGEGKLRPGY